MDLATREHRKNALHGEFDLLETAMMFPSNPILPCLVLLGKQEVFLLEEDIPKLVHILKRLLTQ